MEKLKDICKRIEDIVSAEIAKGAEQIDTHELGEAIDMIKDMKEAMYYGSVVKAMEESDEEEKMMDKLGMSDRYYRGQPRNARGQFKADGRPNKYYNPTMMPEIYSLDMYDKMPMDMQREYMRGYSDGVDTAKSMSRNYPDPFGNHGETNMSATQKNNMVRDYREGRSGMSRARYFEAKDKHSANTSEDKQAKMTELEHYMNELSADVTEMISDATTEEKTMLRNKLTTLANKI